MGVTQPPPASDVQGAVRQSIPHPCLRVCSSHLYIPAIHRCASVKACFLFMRPLGRFGIEGVTCMSPLSILLLIRQGGHDTAPCLWDGTEIEHPDCSGATAHSGATAEFPPRSEYPMLAQVDGITQGMEHDR